MICRPSGGVRLLVKKVSSLSASFFFAASGSIRTRCAVTTRRTWPSIFTVKSGGRRSSTGLPVWSITPTSTVTSSTPLRKVGVCDEDGAGLPAVSCASAVEETPERIASATSSFLMARILDPRTGGRQLDVPEFQRLQDSAGPVANAEFRQDAGGVVLDGSFRGAQRVGDLAIAVAARHQPQDLDLAPGQRIRRTQRVEVPVHVFEAAQHPFGHGGPGGRSARGDLANGLGQLLERDVLQQIASRSGPHRLEQRHIIIKGCQDDYRREIPFRLQCLEYLDAVLFRHPEIEQHHVRLFTADRSEAVVPIGRLRDYRHVAGEFEQRAHALPDQVLIVDEDDADHARGGRGMIARTSNPASGPGAASTRPPNCSKRSRIPRNPFPIVNVFAPRPSSRACRVTPVGDIATRSHRLLACAWRAVFVSTSCTARSSASARAGSSISSGVDTSTWTRAPIGCTARARIASARSSLLLSRSVLTTSRTSLRSSLVIACACWMWSAALPVDSRVATSSCRLSAVR